MAYQRRHSVQSRQSNSRSDEDQHLTSPNAPLSPPRPFFISSGNAADRGSYSSAEDAGSDSDREPAVAPKSRNHRRRSQMAQYAAVEPESPNPVASPRDPFMTPSHEGGWSPHALYEDNSRTAARAPPSSFTFPFQAHTGNPDPGMSIPGVSRRSSVESLRRNSSVGHEGTAYPPVNTAQGYGHLSQGSPSATELTHDGDLGRPYAPFMGPGGVPQEGGSHSRRSSMHSQSHPDVYRNSAAGAFQGQGASPTLGAHPDLPRTSSVGTFRAPFLSPASRPNSSFWTPPQMYGASTPGASGSAVALSVQKHRPPMPSSRLAAKLTTEEKPWIKEKDTPGRISWWLTFFMMLIGVGAGAVLCWQGYSAVLVLKDDQLCQVMSDNFQDGSLNEDIWNREVQLGGFGNGEFEATTKEDKNLYLKNGNLYIMPTLTADDLGNGWDEVFDGGQLDLGTDCTTDNSTACSSSSSKQDGQVLQPVKSARINTKDKYSIQFGKVEVRAKLPRGDWLWPAIWMLPVDESKYGQWPLSGEIDIMEARGNDASYGAQGNNVVRSSLNYGPLPGTQARLFGWQAFKRESLAADFHTYTIEWTPDFMRLYIDTRLQAMLEFNQKKKNFFDRGGFPKTAKNGTDTEVVINNIWDNPEVNNNKNSAPFDQEFYLIINLAVGGTSGWFPDGVGNKSWYDGSKTAMSDFAQAHDTWYSTWPSSEQDRAFRIDSVKMWKYGKC